MSNNFKHFVYGFTHAFNSSVGAYNIEKTWDITKRIQTKRKDRIDASRSRTAESIRKLYAE